MATNRKALASAAGGIFAILLLGACAELPRGAASVRAVWPDLVVHLHGVQAKAYLVDSRTDAVVAELALETPGTVLGSTTSDGRYAFVTHDGNNIVSILDAKTLRPAKDLAIGKGRMGHVAFTRDGRCAYVSNAGGGNLHKVDMQRLEVVKEIPTGKAPGASQVLNVWTNVFGELARP